MDDTSYNLNQSATTEAGEKHSTLMQFNDKNDSYTNSHVNLSDNNIINNNNNENNIFVTSKNTPTTQINSSNNIHKNNNNNKGSNDHHLAGSTSPSHLSSNSSVSSQAQNNDECDSITNNNHRANNSSPPSPQSSYNSSYGSSSGQKLINNSINSVTSLVPGGVVTTQNISTVIKPKGNNNSLQFVKIQTPELSKKAVEQIKMAEDSKINKDKIKEVEEEWQSNLLNWKSKRRQQFNFAVDHEPNNPFETSDSSGGRKIKTFAEMIEQRAKSGNRLGFHLQRYIGADGDEDSSNIPATTKTEDDTRVFDEPDKSNIRNDSDCEARPPSSNPVSPVAPMVAKRAEPSLTKNEQAKTSNIVSAKSDESDNSGFDEDDEDGGEEEDQEEEEQKHLQRIAFEAKLKAFEKLTKPTPPSAPKFVTNRINRTSTTPIQNKPISKVDIVPRERQTLQHPQQQKQPLLQPLQQTQHQPQQKQYQQHEQQQQYQRLQPQPKQQQQLPSPIKVKESSCPKSTTETIHLETKEPQPISSETSTPTKLMVKDDRLHSTPNISTSVSSIQIDRSLSQKSIDNSIQRVQDSFKQVNIVQKPVPIPKPPVMQPPLPEPLSKTVPTIQQHSNNFNQVTTMSPQKSRSIVNQPLPESPKSVSSQRKLPRDDKDRTVLSVSGKKRCSSCKEELGRGAAAFVVESLSLVYHTNCFRCSVCHVNLSNGFRGVDVRVHAGALHCQNCYSKDGLNYSRV